MPTDPTPTHECAAAWKRETSPQDIEPCDEIFWPPRCYVCNRFMPWKDESELKYAPQ